MTTLRCTRYPNLAVATRHGTVRFRDGVATATPEQAKSMAGLPDEYGITVEDSPGGGESGSGPGVGKRPARSASKAAWAEYARSVAATADEVDAIDDMTKDQLIEQYGGE